MVLIADFFSLVFKNVLNDYLLVRTSVFPLLNLRHPNTVRKGQLVSINIYCIAGFDRMYRVTRLSELGVISAAKPPKSWPRPVLRGLVCGDVSLCHGCTS